MHTPVVGPQLQIVEAAVQNLSAEHRAVAETHRLAHDRPLSRPRLQRSQETREHRHLDLRNLVGWHAPPRQTRANQRRDFLIVMRPDARRNCWTALAAFAVGAMASRASVFVERATRRCRRRLRKQTHRTQNNGNQDHHHTISDRDYTLAIHGSCDGIRATSCAIRRRNAARYGQLSANSFSLRGGWRAFSAGMVRTNKKLDPSQTGNNAAKLRSSLQKLVVGQEEPIAQIVNIYQMWTAGMTDPNRPIGSFLFLGPTGTGKTRLVEATAESLLGDPRSVIKIDCGEFQQSHEIAKLIGSPPGYLGHRETHAALSQEALNHHHTESTRISFVLFDEIEKASDAVWNLLLGILDKATLTLGDNRKVDFSQCMIFMTSNIGAADMEAMVRPKLGFSAGNVRARTKL